MIMPPPQPTTLATSTHPLAHVASLAAPWPNVPSTPKGPPVGQTGASAKLAEAIGTSGPRPPVTPPGPPTVSN